MGDQVFRARYSNHSDGASSWRHVETVLLLNNIKVFRRAGTEKKKTQSWVQQNTGVELLRHLSAVRREILEYLRQQTAASNMYISD